ncbi:efflux RND transporter periplasmic adaptor subunit [Kaistia dalseonensis]|uniref:RND family efflux transporter MFP subunit n=1 Tax=Kaistia dalseonensis TaxID=410840 RepID=A0ABU0HD32_9HYPH|nr:efflux RND transporter periplasmic adaptor subunit [Kaistia dalseonensis]MCX5497567.1 efflux RND transporter periplasmic adaptor subunit [Kaistia dalseonensis]MDQ0440207.1 RND family efflux transporter MFP subunit [Kaistia dalseonensis]
MSLWKQALLCLVVLAVAAGGWYAFQHRADYFGSSSGGTETAATGAGQASGGAGAAPARRQGGGGFGPTPVVTDRVGSDIEAQDVRAVGTVFVSNAINIYPQVSALVTEVLFKGGDEVKAGQVLVRLDDADQKVALDLANVGLSDAQKTLDRSQKLAATNNLTQSVLQDAQSAVRKAQIAQLSAQIALDRRTITAPFAGVVGISTLSVGDLVTTSTVVTTLDDLTTMKVTFLVPERFSDRLTLGQSVTAIADSAPDNPIPGKLTAVDSRVDAATRSLKVEATLDAAAALAVGVKPGMSVKTALSFEGAKRLTVSALAIQWDRNGSYVWKVDGDAAKRVSISVLERQSGRVMVSGDLAEGDKIVVEGLQRLREGAKVAEVGRSEQPVAKAEG